MIKSLNFHFLFPSHFEGIIVNEKFNFRKEIEIFGRNQFHCYWSGRFIIEETSKDLYHKRYRIAMMISDGISQEENSIETEISEEENH